MVVRIYKILFHKSNMDGVIKKLTDKGFGFIAVEGEEKDIFFHANALSNVGFEELSEGDSVTFDREDSAKGANALNVTKI